MTSVGLLQHLLDTFYRCKREVSNCNELGRHGFLSFVHQSPEKIQMGILRCAYGAKTLFEGSNLQILQLHTPVSLGQSEVLDTRSSKRGHKPVLFLQNLCVRGHKPVISSK